LWVSPSCTRRVITTTPFEISLIKDAKVAETYRSDGSEAVAKDVGTAAGLDRRYSFTLVAGMAALTSKRTRGAFTNIITDAYAARRRRAHPSSAN
jgi:hypothetical protein